MAYLGLDSPFGVAHRGGSLERLENTPAAFEHAISLGYQVIETDVQVTSDGVLAVIHDEFTGRVSPRNIRVDNCSWSELSTIPLNNGQNILRLEQLLEFIPDSVRLNIDPKSNLAIGPLISLLRNRPELSQRICFGSFNSERLQEMRREVPGISTSLGVSEFKRLMLAFVSGVGRKRVIDALPDACAVQIPLTYAGLHLPSRRFVEFAHDINLDVHVWTIDNEQTMRTLYGQGVDAVMTDRPTVLKNVLQDLGHWKGN